MVPQCVRLLHFHRFMRPCRFHSAHPTIPMPYPRSAALILLSLACLMQPARAATAAPCAPDAGWDDPGPAVPVFGNTWYVGTCAISVLLITGERGHVLIDGGTGKAPPLVEANVRKLGFRMEDIRFILNSHAHHDHAGGIAELQRMSGATVIARGKDADAIERGIGDRSDPQFIVSDRFAPARNVRRIANGETLALGATRITAHATTGHTPGSTSWSWTACEGSKCLRFVYADSVTPISDDVYRYSDEAAHPGVVAAFRAGLKTIANLPCDVLLTPHPSASNMWDRMGAGARMPLADTEACRRYAAAGVVKLDTRLAKEALPK